MYSKNLWIQKSILSLLVRFGIMDKKNVIRKRSLKFSPATAPIRRSVIRHVEIVRTTTERTMDK